MKTPHWSLGVTHGEDQLDLVFDWLVRSAEVVLDGCEAIAVALMSPYMGVCVCVCVCVCRYMCMRVCV